MAVNCCFTLKRVYSSFTRWRFTFLHFQPLFNGNNKRGNQFVSFRRREDIIWRPRKVSLNFLFWLGFMSQGFIFMEILRSRQLRGNLLGWFGAINFDITIPFLFYRVKFLLYSHIRTTTVKGSLFNNITVAENSLNFFRSSFFHRHLSAHSADCVVLSQKRPRITFGIRN